MNVRFGVALPKEIADELERIAKSMGVTRSKVVELAIRSFLNYLKAINDPEKANFVIILTNVNNMPSVVKELDGATVMASIFDGNKVLMVIKTRNGRELFKKLSRVKCSIYPISLLEQGG